jgi:hypothetical protein
MKSNLWSYLKAFPNSYGIEILTLLEIGPLESLREILTRFKGQIKIYTY